MYLNTFIINLRHRYRRRYSRFPQILSKERVTKEKNTVVKASTSEHKHDMIQDNGSGVEVFCGVI